MEPIIKIIKKIKLAMEERKRISLMQEYFKNVSAEGIQRLLTGKKLKEAEEKKTKLNYRKLTQEIYGK